MSFLTADEALQDQLRGILEPVEIRDQDGNVLGHYAPVLSAEEEEAYARAAKLFDPVELDRIEREEKGQGRPLRELWQRLGVSEQSA